MCEGVEKNVRVKTSDDKMLIHYQVLVCYGNSIL